MSAGRPLRFLLLVAGGWIGVRAAMLWPVGPVSMIEKAVAPVRGGVTMRRILPLPETIFPRWRAAQITAHALRLPHPRSSPAQTPALRPLPSAVHDPAVPISPGLIAGLPQPLPKALPPPDDQSASRLGGSAWIVLRGGSGAAASGLSPQLGESQAGARLTYAVTANRRLALAARIASPTDGSAREAAFGLEWQPTRWPVRIIAEQRIAIDAGRGGPTLGLVGGFGPAEVGAGFAAEGYAQAGVIGRGGGEGFADGAVRLARPVAAIGLVKIDLGVGGWGAAQKGASRLDIGPSLAARLPLAGNPVRLSLDWRQRIAGNAVPVSGVVLSLGTDF